MPDARINVTDDWETICSYLPKDYAELAEKHKQVLTQYGNAKIRTADDLLRLVLLHVGTDLPLRQTVAVMAASGGPVLSHVRLHKKMVRAVPYLRALVREMLDTRSVQPEKWAGYEVVAVDASAVCGPGAETTDARLHVQLRLSDLDLLTVRVTGVEVGESFKRFTWKPGQLALGDRGYSNAPGIGAVVDRGADVLVRVNRGSLPLRDGDGNPIDLMSWLRRLRGHDAHEQDAVIHNRETNRKIRGRLIALRLPAAQAEKARARLQRELKGKVTELDREAAGYVVLFTTVPKSRLDTTRCLELYRLRWQVELLFKRWKSLCGFDRLPNYLDETILAWLYAKVLLALLMERMASSALSPPKDSTTAPRQRQLTAYSPAMEAGFADLASDDVCLASTWAA
jgi:Transposase DDE domain